MGFPYPIKHVITEIKPAHCTAGSRICDKCKEIMAKPPAFCLLELSEENIARFLPTISIKENGKNKLYLYQLIRIFKNRAEAENYARKNNTEIVKTEG